MRAISYIFIFLYFCTFCESAIKNPVAFSLNLEQEIFITDKTGNLIPNSITKLTPSNSVCIYLPDGTELKGIVKTTELINSEVFKVFGEIHNEKNVGFGFVITKTGILAGAIVFRDKDITYVVNFDEKTNKYSLIKKIEVKSS